jgi:hypothetical protein
MTPSELIDQEIADHPDWRGHTMAEIRRIIREAVPDVTEEWKWRGTPTWSHNGILCICNAFKSMVKVTFLNGAKLRDVDGVFNAELGGNQWRAIKLFQGDKVNASGLKKLLVAAVALNAVKGAGKARPARAGGTRTSKPARATQRPARASGKTVSGARAAPKAKRAAARGASPKR